MATVIDQIDAFNMFRRWWNILGDNVNDVKHIRKTIVRKQKRRTSMKSYKILKKSQKLYIIEEGNKYSFFKHVLGLLKFEKFCFQFYDETLPTVIKNIVNEYVGIESMIDDMKGVYYLLCRLDELKYQHPEMCLVRLFIDPRSIRHIKNPTPELCLAALLLDSDTIQYLDSSNKLLHLLAGGTRESKTLSKLESTISFCRKNRETLPASRTHLTFGFFNQKTKENVMPSDLPLHRDTLPAGLTHLEFGGFPNRERENVLPPNLHLLKFNNDHVFLSNKQFYDLFGIRL